MVYITKSGSSVTIDGSTYNVQQIKASNYSTEIRIEASNSVVLDRTNWADISYNGVPLANADALATLANNITS